MTKLDLTALKSVNGGTSYRRGSYTSNGNANGNGSAVNNGNGSAIGVNSSVNASNRSK